jgi:hypothetical protein
MLNENPTNLNWKNKLDDAEALSGETLADKNAAWEKLYHRMQPQRGRVHTVWYWAVAACILFAIIFSILLPIKKQAEFVKVEPMHVMPKIESPGKALPVERRKELATVVAGVEKRVIIIKAIQSNKEILLTKEAAHKIAILPPELGLSNVPQPVQPTEQSAVQDMPVVKAIAALGTIQKLRVVHVNELGDAPPEIHSRGFIADYRTVQIKLINQEVYTNASSAINNPGFNFLKTTNAPSN